MAIQGKRGSQRRHDRINEEVYNRAWEVHYDALRIIKNYEWENGSKRGEIDVYVEYPDYEIFYEIKSANRYRKAVQQFKRYCRAHPEKNVKGIYVSPYETCRIRLDKRKWG